MSSSFGDFDFLISERLSRGNEGAGIFGEGRPK